MREIMSELELGAFSMSLSVRDIDASCEFYEKFGFEVTGRTLYRLCKEETSKFWNMCNNSR